MVSPFTRALCASVAVALFLGSAAGLVLAPHALFAVTLFVAAIVAVPAMYGGGKPAEHDLPRIDEQLHRFRGAMLICFAGAAGVYATVLTARGRPDRALLQQLSALGVSLWLIGFVLLFFVAYYSTQRRLAAR